MVSTFSKDFSTNKKKIDSLLQVDKSFDLIYRVITIGGKTACFYIIDGFCKDEVMEKIMEFLYKITPDQMPETAHDFLKTSLPYGEIDLIAQDDAFVVFAEVKLRKSASYGAAREFVDLRKQERLRATASMFLEEHETALQPRFDVIEIYAPDGLQTRHPYLRQIEDAFYEI